MVRDNTTRRRFLAGTAAGTVGTLFVGGAGASRAPSRVVGVTSPEAAADARDRAESVRRTLDFGDIGMAVAGRFSDRTVEELRRRRDVRYVEADGTVHAIGDRPGANAPPWEGGGGEDEGQTLPYGVDRVDAEVAHANGYTGAGADVAVLDTGIDSDHPDLEANLGEGKAFVKCRGRSCNVDWDDDNDHGTHCAGTTDAVDNAEGVVGVSTEATLHAVKVLDKRGSGSFSDVAAGLEYTADRGWDVASMSLGASSGSQTVKDACTYAYGRGVLLVAAAGNSGPCTDCVGYPAAYSEVIAVSATDAADALASFSSTGSEVELAAPGADVLSTVPGGGYDTFSGTSMACPHVAGAGGQLMARGYTNAEARDRLAATAEDVGLSADEQGNGLLDVAAALGLNSDDDLN
ncbi:S8 family serine peptidase [Halomarina halobia]|uniref:S8 family serine peptidase n=1 Tax=Halomarina halobia TaxID=3033386 RepID=A0ABD6AAP4_9EURY|nr:S8 family peptidase [Halomarina sp. PSR21]